MASYAETVTEGDSATIEPDTKDWTWVLDRRCPDCGFAAGEVSGDRLAPIVRSATTPWQDVLRRPDVAARPQPGVWSPLEYGCHVRDVCRVFVERLTLMLTQDQPGFADWDQDAAAVAGDYGAQDPATVAGELAADAAVLADRYATVRDDQWNRSGLRSNGSAFTVLTLGRYLAHDLVHHLHDVGASAQA